MRGPGGLRRGRGGGHPVPRAPHPLGVWKRCHAPRRRPGRERGPPRVPVPPRAPVGVSSPCPGTGGATDRARGRRHPRHHQGLQPGPARAGRAGHGPRGRSALRRGRAGVRRLQQVSGRRGAGTACGHRGWLQAQSPAPPGPGRQASGLGLCQEPTCSFRPGRLGVVHAQAGAQRCRAGGGGGGSGSPGPRRPCAGLASPTTLRPGTALGGLPAGGRVLRAFPAWGTGPGSQEPGRAGRAHGADGTLPPRPAEPGEPGGPRLAWRRAPVFTQDAEREPRVWRQSSALLRLKESNHGRPAGGAPAGSASAESVRGGSAGSRGGWWAPSLFPAGDRHVLVTASRSRPSGRTELPREVKVPPLGPARRRLTPLHVVPLRTLPSE